MLRRLGDNMSSLSVELLPEAEYMEGHDQELITKISAHTAKAKANALKDKH